MSLPHTDATLLDEPPQSNALTAYDRRHLVTYLRLLDADGEGADPAEVARIVLNIDPGQEPERARRAYHAHLARARWMMQAGYRHLLAEPKLR